MRILWLDSSAAPWKESDGWEYLESFQLEFIRVADASEARARLDSPLPIAVAVVNADIPGALDLVADLKSAATRQQPPVILVSESWTKKDFKAHSTSPYAAANYARLPMPAPGFADVVSGLTGVALQPVAAGAPPAEDDPSALLAGETAAPPPSLPKPKQAAPAVPPARGKGAIQTLKEAISPWKKSEQVVEPLGSYSKADAEVLRKYLVLREQELSRALADKQSLERLHEKVTRETEELRKQFRELERMKAEAEDKCERLERKKHDQEKALNEQGEKAAFEQESLRERIHSLESQLEESKARYASLKERVRKDIRKIQTREKELETRLELVKKDSETLIAERDRQVLELKRKIDALEFDLDLIQDRKVQAETNANKYVDKLSRVARTLQVAFGMLEEVKEEPEKLEATKPILGGAATAVDTPASRTDEAAIDELLKPAEALDAEALAEAEAPTRIFSKDSDADKLLAGAMEGSEGAEGEGKSGNSDDDLDQALGS